MSKTFQAKIWMKSKDGENDLSMFINEQPQGGFRWEFLDFDPCSNDYSPMYIHNFSLSDIEEINKELTSIRAQLKEKDEVIGFYADDDNWVENNHRNNLCDIIGFEDCEDVNNQGIRFGGKRARAVLEKYKEKTE